MDCQSGLQSVLMSFAALSPDDCGESLESAGRLCPAGQISQAAQTCSDYSFSPSRFLLPLSDVFAVFNGPMCNAQYFELAMYTGSTHHIIGMALVTCTSLAFAK